MLINEISLAEETVFNCYPSGIELAALLCGISLLGDLDGSIHQHIHIFGVFAVGGNADKIGLAPIAESVDARMAVGAADIDALAASYLI